MYYSSAVCPQCGQVDAVRKVSSIVSEGTTQTQQFGVAPNLAGSDFFLVGLQGSSVTNLAQRLAPPAQRPGGIGIRLFMAAAAFVLGSTMACGLAMFAGTPEFGRFACGNWVLGIALLAAVLIILPLSGIPKIRQKQATYGRMMYQAHLRWDRLYYCSRDDVTFTPDQNVVIPIQYLSQYLYAEAGA